MSERGYDVPAVRKAISVIELLCESTEPLGISEISQQLEINKNMVFRLVRTLVESGWIMPANGDNLKYRMTLQAFQHTSKPVSRMSVRSECEQPLRKLWEQTQASCYLCVLDHRRALCVEHIDGTGVLRVSGKIGGLYYLHSTAPGKILLAHEGRKYFDQLDENDLPQLTSKTICKKRVLWDHIEQIKERGYATDVMENAEGVICYAVPVYNYEDKVVGSLGLTTLTYHYSLESMIAEFAPMVDAAGREASLAMGASEDVLQSYRVANSTETN